MTSHKDCQLDRLGITSQQEADELERELDIHFDQFTHYDREVWVQQNAYLDAYALNRTVTESADMAGVTVSNAQGWTYLNTLGFKRRLEIADLRFSDNLQVMALERAREPDAPASLLIALLRAHIPEKFSSNGHVCDTSKADELLFHFSQDALREKNAGHPTFRAIANGTYQPRPPRRNSSPTMPSAASPPTQTNRHTGGGRYPEIAHLDSIQSDQEISSSHEPPSGLPHDDIQPVDSDEVAYYNLSPSDRKNTPHPSAPAAHSAVYPPAQTNRHTGGGRYPENAHPDSIESDQEISSSHEPPSGLPHDDIQPVDSDEVAYYNLSPSDRKNTPHPSAVNRPAPSAANRPQRRPIASLFQKARRNPDNDHNTFKVKRF